MATRKPAVPQDEKFENQDFDLFKALEAIDRKDYGWFDTLTEDQQRKFVPYMMLHWMSAIKATGMLGAYYVMSTDANANKHMFNERVQQHPKLQWLMLCAASPGMGKQFHQWIPHLNAKLGELKSVATKKEVKDYFDKVFTGVSASDIDEAASQYIIDQHHKVRLAKMYPEMKIVDIEALSHHVTKQDIDNYELECGN
jgi:hypothetical protein